jgi:protein KRI1
VQEKYGPDATLGDDDDSEDSESDETEDEDGEDLTPAMDAAILRTLARIRSKDPAIYENTQSVFERTLLNTSKRRAHTRTYPQRNKLAQKQQNRRPFERPRRR